jgi:uncharacterized protein (DUF302 family)
MKTKITPRHPLAALAVLAMVLVSGMATAAGDGVITQTATGSYEQIVTGLKKAITANKLVIVKEVPFTQMLAMVGVKVEKIKSFEIFHPRFGKVIHANDKNALLEVPLRILVREKGGKTIIQYRKPSAAFAGYSGLSGLGGDLDKVFAKIVGSVAK